jgi:hypothetical protein
LAGCGSPEIGVPAPLPRPVGAGAAGGAVPAGAAGGVAPEGFASPGAAGAGAVAAGGAAPPGGSAGAAAGGCGPLCAVALPIPSINPSVTAAMAHESLVVMSMRRI